MSSLLAGVGEVLTELGGWVGTIANTIINTPILLVTFVLGLAFTGIRLFHSLKG